MMTPTMIDAPASYTYTATHLRNMEDVQGVYVAQRALCVTEARLLTIPTPTLRSSPGQDIVLNLLLVT